MVNLDWYHSLNLPAGTPPDWIFAPVWIILYLMIFASFLVFISTKSLSKKFVALSFFVMQLLLNFFWSSIFFGLKDILNALWVILLMWIFLAITLYEFYKISKPAFYLLIPYFLWVTYALYLNSSIYLINP